MRSRKLNDHGDLLTRIKDHNKKPKRQHEMSIKKTPDCLITLIVKLPPFPICSKQHNDIESTDVNAAQIV